MKMFYTVNHCIVPFDWKQLCSAFFAETVVKIIARGGGLIFILIQGRHSKRPKIGHVNDVVILLLKLLPEKEFYRVLFLCKIRAFVI